MARDCCSLRWSAPEIMAQRLAGGNIALALLCNTIATGAALTVLILIFGTAVRRAFQSRCQRSVCYPPRTALADAALYIAAQIAGGIFGVWVAHLMFDLIAAAAFADGPTGPGQWFSEAVATFGLLLTIFGGLASAPASVPYAVGLYITAAYWFTASTSFANPAVTVARSLSDTFAGIAPADVPAFLAAQAIGAAAAVAVSGWLWRKSPASGARL